MPIISTLEMWRQKGGYKFKATLNYIQEYQASQNHVVRLLSQEGRNGGTEGSAIGQCPTLSKYDWLAAVGWMKVNHHHLLNGKVFPCGYPE